MEMLSITNILSRLANIMQYCQIFTLICSTCNFLCISGPILKIFIWLERKENKLSKYVIYTWLYPLNYFLQRVKSVFFFLD